MKTIRVVAAVLHRGGRIFATQRGYGAYKDYWEFPGGKVEPGESPEQAVVREIREELETVVTPERLLMTVEYDYPEFHLSMDCFLCSGLEGNLTLLEHESAKWLGADQLDSVDWLPADWTVIEFLRTEIEEGRLV